MNKPFTVLQTTWFRLAALLRRVSLAEKSTVFAAAVAATSLFAFVEIADDMTEGDTTAFDTQVLLAFRDAADRANPLGPAWLEVIMRDFTALGGVAVLTTVTLLVAGFLILTRKRHAAWMVLFSVSGGILLSNLLKWGFARPRPDLVPHATAVYSQSFPSGHAMLSAVVYLTLGTLLARTQSDIRVKIYLLAAASTLTLLVGISRIYLGVHWPTDVLAGWAGGAAWALMCWMLMLWLQGKGRIEAPNGGA
ncbi:MAG TPA: phosphatase PAP2 family protein [Noviherbaspirillum sp.]